MYVYVGAPTHQDRQRSDQKAHQDRQLYVYVYVGAPTHTTPSLYQSVCDQKAHRDRQRFG
jgi:hypothetical protein